VAGGEVSYRRANEADRGAVFDVLRTANFHRVPSPEMPELDLSNVFVAESAGSVVGLAGYRVVAEGEGKTTLMAVSPAWRHQGIGERLQELRLKAMQELGCRRVTTNADLPVTIAWYERRFGYREIGRVQKLHDFGAADVDHWTTLELELDAPPP
jgi:N-acetylglutamate synthase-like GNAT family acetyltransferase